MPNIISSFFGEYRFLSNFETSPHGIPYEGLAYPTVEHAYQAAKTLNQAQRVRICNLPTPGQAKRAGRHLDLREDWEEVKVSVMRTLLEEKFTDPGHRMKLLETGDAVLVEGNTWGDTFWGVCEGKGKNVLGRLLMALRSKLREG
jgi:ribA/ribD-fused uncharacterized protein